MTQREEAPREERGPEMRAPEREDAARPLRPNGLQCMVIVGQIEGHQLLPDNTKATKYEHVLPQLAAMEESPDVRGLLLMLNTMGGDVEAGLAIAETVAGMTKPVASLVLGGGHSIGVPLAVAARRSFIAPSASMTVHPVRISGTLVGVPQTYAYMERVQERVVRFITDHSRIDRERLRGLMYAAETLSADTGTVLCGEEAVRLGLIDALGGLSDALAWLHAQTDVG